MKTFDPKLIMEAYDKFESERKWIFKYEKIDRAKYMLNQPVRVVGSLPCSISMIRIKK